MSRAEVNDFSSVEVILGSTFKFKQRKKKLLSLCAHALFGMKNCTS